MNTNEVLKLALEALEAGEYYIDDLEAIVYAADDLGTHEDRAKMQSAVTALREALAEQPAQQEPVAYAVYHRKGGGKSLHWPEQHSPDFDANEYQLVPLYTSPPAQRKPLTDEQIYDMYNEPRSDAEMVEFARAIEAAHNIKEKNT